jgi:hypothetical protein
LAGAGTSIISANRSFVSGSGHAIFHQRIEPSHPIRPNELFGKEFVVHPPSLIEPNIGEFGIALSASSPAYIQSMLSR